MGVSIVMGNSHSWMVYFMENPIQKWMMQGGTPILGNHQRDFFWLMVNQGIFMGFHVHSDLMGLHRDFKGNLSGWWLSPTPLKNMSLSVGINNPNT